MKWLTSFGRAVISCYKSLLLTQLRVLDRLILDHGLLRVLTCSRRVLLVQLDLVYRLAYTPTQSLA
ncbi:5a protein [Infectious bronchitis virus]|uniref:Non-structural protein 5a n=3 Tax=Infectious bronchitis virus TaxID=11120 RepID=NS5A_IBVB|nr:5a protein [Infectious bronchitis virus]Q89613.1 RecName: Full=Non-structural protein 5a; Short=ns5a; AltName: Full=Accessory protein 5a [Avian infectious bronchitis virus (strain Beaudette)]UNG30114.1 5a protein [Avian coronavirus]URN97283.1 5a protein [Vector pBAC-Beaudette-FU]CAC39119.1 5a protein [Avian infectious bronchitis virus (strain Beaudette CK)]BDI54797.1 5a protein [synthetic construct]AAA46218.1 ORF2 [Infectious bronchitis virus]